VGLARRERRQPWAAMPKGEVAGFPGAMGSPLGRSRSQWERVSLFRMKFRRAASDAWRVAAHAVSGAPTTSVHQAITSSTQHVPLTDEVPRRPAPGGPVSPGYKSHTKGRGHASETGRVSPPPRLKGCQQRQSRGPSQRLAAGSGSERQNLRVLGRPYGSMRLVSRTPAATTWSGGTSSCQRVQVSAKKQSLTAQWASPAVSKRLEKSPWPCFLRLKSKLTP
jgi:hypothetical protein